MRQAQKDFSGVNMTIYNLCYRTVNQWTAQTQSIALYVKRNQSIINEN